MTDEKVKKLIARIRPLIKKWRELLYMNHMKIDLTWDRSYSTDPPGMSAMTHMARWKYLEFDITFYLPELIDLKDEDLEAVVVHELTHCLLAPISMNMKGCDESYQVDLMELNTSQVERALLHVRDEGSKK